MPDRNIVEYIKKTYTGISKLERLSYIATIPDLNAALSASLEAIQCFDIYNATSPDIEQIYLPRIKELSPIQYEDLVTNSWEKTLSARVENKFVELSKLSFYQESDMERLIDLARIQIFNKNYSAANDVLIGTSLGSKTCRLSEISAQIGILQGNYNLTLAQDKKAESFLSGCLNHEMYADKLTDDEITYYFRIKFLIIFANFLRRNYEEVVKSFDNLLKIAIKSHQGTTYTWLEIFNDVTKFGRFINKEEIIKAYVISQLLSCPTKELKTVTNSKNFSEIVGSEGSIIYRDIFLSLSSADFKTLFQLLQNKFDRFSYTNIFFKKVWNDAQLELRYKAYDLYLSLAVRVDATHLSTRLSIEKIKLIRELKGFIKDKELEFEYIEEGEIFTKIKIDKHEAFVNRLTKATEEIDAIESNLKEHAALAKRKFEIAKGNSTAQEA